VTKKVVRLCAFRAASWTEYRRLALGVLEPQGDPLRLPLGD
jgi:hypothetical protein